jgi:Endopolygalacturonase
MSKIKIFALIAALILSLNLSAKEYKASLFGVKSEGITLNTKSIQKAIDYISENGGGKLVFYVGRYLTGTIQLKSNVTIELKEGAILVATPSIYDYFGAGGPKALIVADGQENIGIMGKGVIEGHGTAILDQVNAQIQKGYLKETVTQASPALIALNNCTNITIDEFYLFDPAGNVQVYSGCKKLAVSGVTVKSKGTKDSKGIILSGCDGVTLSKIYFETSGKEIETAGNSKNVSTSNCKNSTGKTITVIN